MIERFGRKTVRVEEVPRKSILEAKKDMLTALDDYMIQGTQEAMSTMVKSYRGYEEARTPPKQQVVIFDSFKVKLP